MYTSRPKTAEPGVVQKNKLCDRVNLSATIVSPAHQI